MFLSKAIESLYPNAQWKMLNEDYEHLEWLSEDITKPTLQELENEVDRLISVHQTQEYQRQRALEYPNIGDQLDMLWHAIDTNSLNKTSDFYTAIKAVKDAYPKS